MVAPSSTVVNTPCGSVSSHADEAGVSTYIQEIATGTARGALFQDTLAVRSLCQALLALERRVATANRSKSELADLLRLLDVLVRDFLDQCQEQRSTGPGARYDVEEEGLTTLAENVDRAKEVAEQCNRGCVVLSIIGSKLARRIEEIKGDVVEFATANKLVLSNALYVSPACWSFWGCACEGVGGLCKAVSSFMRALNTSSVPYRTEHLNIKGVPN